MTTRPIILPLSTCHLSLSHPLKDLCATRAPFQDLSLSLSPPAAPLFTASLHLDRTPYDISVQTEGQIGFLRLEVDSGVVKVSSVIMEGLFRDGCFQDGRRRGISRTRRKIGLFCVCKVQRNAGESRCEGVLVVIAAELHTCKKLEIKYLTQIKVLRIQIEPFGEKVSIKTFVFIQKSKFLSRFKIYCVSNKFYLR